MTKEILLAGFLFFFFSFLSFAQPANDECVNPIVLGDVTPYCSNPGEFTNIGATASADPNPSCFNASDTKHDVWFAFVAQATEVNISVVGNTDINQGGTLNNPQFALYAGTCGNLTEIQCSADAINPGFNAVESFAGPLNVGQTYYIRVDGVFGNTGTFQLCVNNFNEVPVPSGDCNTAVILCDKSPFVVEAISGVGNDPNEINNTGCDDANCDISESSSTWYKWTCDQSGTLTFNLTPLNPSDDLDFLVYELPNGVDDCNGKNELRCMASGRNVNQNISTWLPCTGVTGLAINDPDLSETCGCQAGDNNFVAAINMVAGNSYALVVNNFSDSGDGFSIDFGGTGTFLGPTAGFNAQPQEICYTESITFTDASTFTGGTLNSWSWNFGLGATPATASGPGPHQVSWDSPGIKSVVLVVGTLEGCLVTEISTINVDPCCTTLNAISASASITDLLCPGIPSGTIDLTASSNAAPLDFSWSSGESSEDISSLLEGDYTVSITNEAGCDTSFTYTVNSPPAIDATIDIVMPTCNGGMDGEICVNTSGGTPPYLYDWNDGNGFGTITCLQNIPIGFYNLTIQDDNGCQYPFIIEVNELVLEIDPLAQAIFPPSCTGFMDGSIVISIINGLPPYQYDFNDGNGFVSSNTLSNIGAGTYIVDAIDANGCLGQFTIDVIDPPPVTVSMDTLDVSCFGLMDGIATAIPGGGVGNYSYSWSNLATDSVITGLDIGQYSVTVSDGNGCTAVGAVGIVQPPELFIDSVLVQDVICHGESNGSISIFGGGGISPYTYSLDGQVFFPDSNLTDLFAGNYDVIIQDANGCQDTFPTSISEPPPISINAGPDQTIDLGFYTVITTALNPPGWPVAYQWQPTESLDCDDCPRVDAFPVNTTTYIVSVIDSAGCVAFDDVTIFVNKFRPIFIPNVFSPNGDGSNDFFTIFDNNAAASQIDFLRVYSRWGELVFETTNIPLNEPSLGWDGTFLGKRVDPGVFVYYAHVRFVDDEVIPYEGSITIVR